MIAEAANFLKDELSGYLLQAGVVSKKDDVLLGNISTFQPHEKQTGKVVISLVNIEEERTLKNVRNPINNNERYVAPPLSLNLYFLFTATLSTSEGKMNKGYHDALKRIDTIIEFFQTKIIFTLSNSAGFSSGNLEESGSTEIRLVTELFTLTFEQINYLWGTLGGKQSPFVMYKIRLVKIQS